MEREKQIQPESGALLAFDPVVLVRDAARYLLWILVIAILFGMAAYVYQDSSYVPVYQTEATLVVTNRSSASSIYNNLDSATNLGAIFEEILNSSLMREKILEELQMDSFNGSIEASAVESTNLVTIRVRAGDPRTAFRVMQVLLEKHEVLTYAVIGDIILEILEHPAVPMYPSNGVNPVSAMKKATVFAAVALAVLAVGLSYFKDVVRSKEEAEQKLSCTCLAEIHHVRKHMTVMDILHRKKRGVLISYPDTNFRYVTTITKLCRRIQQHMHKGKVLMVTSVTENEGKSTISANLALAMAKKYKKVLLIDGDLRKPACRKLMGQDYPAHYIQDVLSGKAALEDAVCQDKLSRMDILMAKRSAFQEAGDLIASDAMKELLRHAAELYDAVVIDLPPMAAAPDAEVVMEIADASLLVVRQNVVRAVDLNRAVSDLERGSAKLLGCVVNDVYSTRVFSGQGYAAGYHHYSNYGRYGKYGRYGAYASERNESGEV